MKCNAVILLFLFLASTGHAEPAKSNFEQIEFYCLDNYTRQASDYSVVLTASELKNQDAAGNNPGQELWTGTSKVIVSKKSAEAMTMDCADWAIDPLVPGDRPGQRDCEQRNSAGELVHKFFLNLRDVTWNLDQQAPFGTGILIIENHEGGIYECFPKK